MNPDYTHRVRPRGEATRRASHGPDKAPHSQGFAARSKAFGRAKALDVSKAFGGAGALDVSKSFACAEALGVEFEVAQRLRLEDPRRGR
jgi:hypothetical protein